MAEVVAFDTGPLSTFSRVRRLDLLEARYSDRIQWTSVVEAEIRRGVSAYPELGDVLDAPWIPPAIRLDKPSDLGEIDRLRRALATSDDPPSMHLGEASVIYLAKKTGAAVALDDFDARGLAKFNGLLLTNTVRIVQDCISMGDVSCDQAFEMYQQMREVSALPDLTKRDLCG